MPTTAKPRIIGITGGIGAGKSVVCRLFSVLGVPVYDADTRAKWLTNNDPTIKAAVIAQFGQEAFTQHGLNRQYLANKVFNDQQSLNTLNGIIHPNVAKDFARWVAQHNNAHYLIKEAALMIESGSYKQVNQLVAVHAPETLRIERTLQRDPHRNKAQVTAIIDKQLPEQQRLSKAHHVIHNDGSRALIPQVMQLHQTFMAGH